ncbi:MAG: tRNA (guanosine(46)-N7)-methyltransferase TrmB [Spirochaetales bacterium]|nr:tRNA (guanosine(46)-N7)-methyltransferase TrmB [Spirochaetales bacterium]
MEYKQNIKSYVLRASRISSGQKLAIEKYSEKHCIKYSGQKLDISEYFSHPLCIEIGFGMGTATAQIAHRNPDKSFLGIEVHLPGIGRLLSKIEEDGIGNLKVINHDAVEVIETMIPESSVEGFHIFFPDPWPKTKQQKRRLINQEFTQLLVSRLKVGGYIYMATDWEHYAQQMLRVLSANQDLQNEYELWAEKPIWRPETAFESKGKKKNHIIRELYFKRVK